MSSSNSYSHCCLSGEELYRWYHQSIRQASDPKQAVIELNWLLLQLTDLDRLALQLGSYQSKSSISSQKSLEQIEQLWQQRQQTQSPLQYLVGKAPWRNLELKVTPSVLIPRPETELVIDLVAQQILHNPHLGLEQSLWVDLGTGSGAIAIALSQLLPLATIYAVDCSKEALTIAQENAKLYGLEDNRITFLEGNWWSPLEGLEGKVQGMISNPPYIPTAMIAELSQEVRHHEPHLALDGGSSGLSALEYLVNTAPLYLSRGGIWLVEIMAGQALLVVELLKQQGSYHSIEIFTDLAGIERFVLAYHR